MFQELAVFSLACDTLVLAEALVEAGAYVVSCLPVPLVFSKLRVGSNTVRDFVKSTLLQDAEKLVHLLCSYVLHFRNIL